MLIPILTVLTRNITLCATWKGISVKNVSSMAIFCPPRPHGVLLEGLGLHWLINKCIGDNLATAMVEPGICHGPPNHLVNMTMT